MDRDKKEQLEPWVRMTVLVAELSLSEAYRLCGKGRKCQAHNVRIWSEWEKNP